MQTTAQFLKALSEEPRLRILALLLGGEICVCDLMAVLQLPQSTISRHLAYLRNTGWVQSRRFGAWMYYRLEEMPNPLAGELLDLLGRRLPELPETRQDFAALEEFRRSKTKCLNQKQETHDENRRATSKQETLFP